MLGTFVISRSATKIANVLPLNIRNLYTFALLSLRCTVDFTLIELVTKDSSDMGPVGNLQSICGLDCKVHGIVCILQCFSDLMLRAVVSAVQCGVLSPSNAFQSIVGA